MSDEPAGSDEQTEQPPPAVVAHPPVPRAETMTPRAPLAPGAEMRLYPSMPPPVSTVPAQWAADPGGGHQWRWWDGVAWTDQVADDGVASTDPLPPR